MTRKKTHPSVSARDFLPEGAGDLTSLRQAAAHCRGCPLYENATQTVFGEGPRAARLMLIGEQPGNDEDLAGRPFVGPSGRLLDRALKAAGIDRTKVYVTNAVKHFKFQQTVGRRLHQKPVQREVVACRPWLEAELAQVRPEVVVLLGATALQSFCGASARLKAYRGRIFSVGAIEKAIATNHPSAILRVPGTDARAQAFDDFVRDLKLAAHALSPRFRRGKLKAHDTSAARSRSA